MQELVIEKMPKLATHLAALHCDITIVATDWFLCLFCTSLPSEVGAPGSSQAPHLSLCCAARPNAALLSRSTLHLANGLSCIVFPPCDTDPAI